VLVLETCQKVLQLFKMKIEYLELSSHSLVQTNFLRILILCKKIMCGYY